MAIDDRQKQNLDLLTALEAGETISQQSLSDRLGIAVGLVNALIKRAVQKGYVKVREVPARRYAYYLTAKGFAEKSRLVAEYLQSSLAFFQESRIAYLHLLEDLTSKGKTRIILAGSGELTEIALLAANSLEVEIVAIFDEKSAQTNVSGYRLINQANKLPEYDALVISDMENPQRYYDKLRQTFPEAQILAPELLKIRFAPLALSGEGEGDD